MVEGIDRGHDDALVARVSAAFAALPEAERPGYAAALELLARLARDLQAGDQADPG